MSSAEPPPSPISQSKKGQRQSEQRERQLTEFDERIERLEELGHEIAQLSLSDQKSLVTKIAAPMRPQDKKEIADEASLLRPSLETTNTLWVLLVTVLSIALLGTLAAIIYTALTALLNSFVLFAAFTIIAIIFAAIIIPRQTLALIVPAINHAYEASFELVKIISGKKAVDPHILPESSKYILPESSKEEESSL